MRGTKASRANCGLESAVPLRALVAWFLCLWWAPTTRAEDWPQFRGPKRDAVWRETGLLPVFPAGGLKVRWRSPVGWGQASPVIVEGRVFVTDVELHRPAAKERILCFGESTGALLWRHEYEVKYPDWAFDHGIGIGTCATAIVEGGRVYALGGSGEVHCLDARSGTVLWARNLGKEYTVRVLECRASPLLEGDLLIVPLYGKQGAGLIALHKMTGRDAWKALNENVASSSPVIVEAGGARQLIIWTGESVTSLNPASGFVHWREPMVTSSNDSISTPVIDGNHLLISGLMMELGADKPTARVLWPGKLAGTRHILSHTSTPVLQGDHVYSARSSGELVCLEAATGRQVWGVKDVTTMRNGSSIHLTPCGDSMYLFTDRGELILARLTPQGYEETSRAHLLEPTTPFMGPKMAWTPPAFANGHVFARNDEEVVCASLAVEP